MSSKQQVSKSKNPIPPKRRSKTYPSLGPDQIVTPDDLLKLREAVRIVTAAHTINVEAKSPKGWAVKRVGGDKHLKEFSLKAEAVKYGRLLCKKTDSDLVIYSKEGKILESKIHGIVRQRASRKTGS